MSNLLQQLQKLKPKLPETEFYVPEWDRMLTLRGFSLREGRELNKQRESMDDDAIMLRILAHAIVDRGERPLANDEGIALLESLSAGTLTAMGNAFQEMTGTVKAAEKNSDRPTAGSDGSSFASPRSSAGPLPN